MLHCNQALETSSLLQDTLAHKNTVHDIFMHGWVYNIVNGGGSYVLGVSVAPLRKAITPAAVDTLSAEVE